MIGQWVECVSHRWRGRTVWSAAIVRAVHFERAHHGTTWQLLVEHFDGQLVMTRHDEVRAITQREVERHRRNWRRRSRRD